MRNNFCNRTIIAVLIVLIGVFVFEGHGTQTHRKLNLHRVFHMSVPFPADGEWPFAVFGGDKRFLHIVEPKDARVEVIEWQQRGKASRATYSDIPCSWQGKTKTGRIEDWVPLSQSYVLMRYCGSIFVVELENLTMKHKLVDAELDGAGVFAVSPDGKQVAVEIGHNRLNTKSQIRVYDILAASVRAEIPVSGFPALLSYSREGDLLVARVDELEPVKPGGAKLDRKSCKVFFWDTRTWELQKQGQYCPWNIEFVRASEGILAEAGPDQFRLLDMTTGAVLHTFHSDRSLSSVKPSQSGRWVAASVVDDQGDAPEYSQDFRIWDLCTGEILYESARRAWPLNPSPDFVAYVQLDISGDDQFLVVTKFEEISVYRIE